MHNFQDSYDEAIKWAIRYFLGREPVDSELAFHKGHENLSSIRSAFSKTSEFKVYLEESGGKRKYLAPLFLLPDKASEVFLPPSLYEKCSCLCTHEQFKEPLYQELCEQLNVIPTMHRKQWEFIWIISTMLKAGLLRPGKRGLGFGTGKEPIPSLLASYGLFVTATDAPIDLDPKQGWVSTNQHSSSLEDLYIDSILPKDKFFSHVTFEPLDMNNIPCGFNSFDFCWSACALEHLGSLKHGLDFIENSLSTLKPGGFAIHTTEFNLSSNDETIESDGLSIYRRQDIDWLINDLTIKGHKVWPINYHPGKSPIDEFIDPPPYGLPHLKLQIQQYYCTSIGIAIQKSF